MFAPYLASTSFRQYTVIGGSNSYGDLLFVFGKFSISEGFNRKSDIALTGVIKLRSKDDALLSILILFFTGNEKNTTRHTLSAKALIEQLVWKRKRNPFLTTIPSVPSVFAFCWAPFFS